MKTLGQRAYERYAALLAIGKQIGKGGKVQVGADPWERLTPRVKHHWETFARGFAKEIIEFHEDHKRSLEAEKERLSVRGDLFEQEVRRRVSEEISRMVKR